MGDHRAGFYSYDWVETFLLAGTVHRVDGRHSASRVHLGLQVLHVGDRIDTGSIAKFEIGSPVTILRPDEALVIGHLGVRLAARGGWWDSPPRP
jgi:hypothetical protein